MIKKEILKNLIADFHTESLPATRKRELQVPLDTGKIVTLTGVRRCGKTFLLFESIKSLLARNVSIRNILYINFEDERLTLSTEDLDRTTLSRIATSSLTKSRISLRGRNLSGVFMTP